MADGEIMYIQGEDFRRMQLLELDMLVEVDRVCRENKIRYGICSGTLLGAIRHKGFIPWDDDMDICFFREEYEKFRKVADQLNPDICWLQDHHTDPEYPWGYSKIRRTGTKYVRVGQEHLKMKTGLFIDVFVLDDIPLSRVGQWAQDKYCFCLRKILYAEIGRMDKRYSAPMRAWWTLLSKIPRQWVHNRIEAMAKHSRNDSSNYVRNFMFPTSYQQGRPIGADPNLKYGVPKTWAIDLAEYEFEGHKFFGTREYEDYFALIYGDWRKLPPEEKRVGNSPCSYYEF